MGTLKDMVTGSALIRKLGLDENEAYKCIKKKGECSNCLCDDVRYTIGHTAVTGGVLYDKEMNVCDIDTGGFCTYKKNKYEGKITVLNIDTKDFVDSSGLSSSLESIRVLY